MRTNECLCSLFNNDINIIFRVVISCLEMCVFFPVQIYPSALFSGCAFFPCAYIHMRFFPVRFFPMRFFPVTIFRLIQRLNKKRMSSPSFSIVSFMSQFGQILFVVAMFLNVHFLWQVL